jgi:hypothetical protein
VKQSARGLENTWGESDEVALFSSVAEYWTRGYHCIFPCWGTLGFVDEEVSQQGTASDLTTQVGLALRLQEGPMAWIARTTSDEVLTQDLKNTIKPYVEPQRAGVVGKGKEMQFKVIGQFVSHSHKHARTNARAYTHTNTHKMQSKVFKILVYLALRLVTLNQINFPSSYRHINAVHGRGAQRAICASAGLWQQVEDTHRVV